MLFSLVKEKDIGRLRPTEKYLNNLGASLCIIGVLLFVIRRMCDIDWQRTHETDGKMAQGLKRGGEYLIQVLLSFDILSNLSTILFAS